MTGSDYTGIPRSRPRLPQSGHTNYKGRAPSPAVHTRRQQVLAYARSGLRPAAIAEVMAYPLSKIRSDVRWLRNAGQYPRRPRLLPPLPARSTVKAALRLLEYEQVMWLLKSSKDGQQLPELLAALIRDAYFEEHGDT